MTRLTLLTLIAAMAVSPALAQQDGSSQRGDTRDVASPGFSVEDDGGFTPGHTTSRHTTRRLTVLSGPGGDPLLMTVDEASAWADTVCGGDSILLFDIDANGDAVESSYDFDCMDDL